MDFCPINLKSWSAALFVAGALINSTRAGNTSIISSVPVDDDAVGSVNSDASAQSARAANSYRAPASTFDMGNSRPMPAPSVSLNPAWQKELDKRKNWMLLTPEEVMGVPTPEKMFGLPDKGDEQNLTLEQRFLKRQEDARMNLPVTGATNSGYSFGLNSKNNSDPFSQTKSSSLFSQPDDNNSSSGASSFSALRMASQSAAGNDSSFSMLRKVGSQDNGAFGNYATAKANDAQIAAQTADMDRFRALLGTSQPADNAPANSTTPIQTSIADAKQPASQFDSAGHWISPSDKFNQLATPATVSGLTGALPKPTPTKRASWQPELPPWLSTGVPTTPPTGPTPRKF